MSFRASAGPPPSPSSILKTATANATTAAKANLPYPQPSSTRSHSSAQLSNSFTGFTKHTTPATPAHASFSATLDTSTASPTVAGAASPTTRFAPASSYSSASSPYRLANQRQHQVIRSFSPYARPAASLSPISFQTSSMLFDFLRDELGQLAILLAGRQSNYACIGWILFQYSWYTLRSFMYSPNH